jgi:general stress protein 26
MSDIQNLSNEDAILKLKELAEEIKVCMFCTKLTAAPFSTRPMGLSEVDEEGKLWFLSAMDSNKNKEIQQDEKVQLLFSSPSGAHFLSVFGEADIYTDEKSIEKAWTPLAKAWFKDGKDDPHLSVIRVYPLDAYYWDTKNGKMVSLIKIAAGAITGNKPDAGVEGQLMVDKSKY